MNIEFDEKTGSFGLSGLTLAQFNFVLNAIRFTLDRGAKYPTESDTATQANAKAIYEKYSSNPE